MLIERPKPITEQVDAIIRQRIWDRTYAPGGRLPSEQELAAELGVSRTTVRSVLAILAVDHLIIRRQGDGTYVNQRMREVNSRLGGLWDFSNIIENSGYQTTVQTLSVKYQPADKQEANRLNIQVGESVLQLVRLFCADAQPVVYSTNVVPGKLMARNGSSYETELALHYFLAKYCNQKIAYVVSNIGATLPDAKIARILKRKMETPLLSFSEVFYNEDNLALALGDNFYDEKRLNLRLIQPWG
jgi:GntR family transcriptional regulator